MNYPNMMFSIFSFILYYLLQKKNSLSIDLCSNSFKSITYERKKMSEWFIFLLSFFVIHIVVSVS